MAKKNKKFRVVNAVTGGTIAYTQSRTVADMICAAQSAAGIHCFVERA